MGGLKWLVGLWLVACLILATVVMCAPVYALERTGTGRIKIVVPVIEGNQLNRRNLSHTVASAYAYLRIQGFDVDEPLYVPLGSTTFRDDYNLGNLKAQGYGLLLMIGVPNGSNPTFFYQNRAHLSTLWDSDSTDVDVLVINEGDLDVWALTENNLSTDVVDIGVNRYVGSPSPQDSLNGLTLDNGTGEISRAKIYPAANFTNYGWAFTPFVADGNTNQHRLAELTDNWAGNPTYGLSNPQVIWGIEQNGNGAPSDSVLAWKLDRDNGTQIGFACLYGDQSHARYTFSWMLASLCLNLAPNLYYESIELSAILDDVCEGGSVDFNLFPTNGTDYATYQQIVADYRKHKMKGIGALCPYLAQESFEGYLDPNDRGYAWTSPNAGASAVKLLNAQGNWKFAVGFHSHRVNYFKGPDWRAGIASQELVAITTNIQDLRTKYKPTLDSLGVKNHKYTPVVSFPSDSYRNYGNTNEDRNNWGGMLAVLSDSLRVYFGISKNVSIAVRKGVNFRGTMPQDGTLFVKDTRSFGIENLSPYRVMAYPDLFYQDSYLVTDPAFIPSGGDTLDLMFKRLDSSQGLGNPHNGATMWSSLYGFVASKGEIYPPTGGGSSVDRAFAGYMAPAPVGFHTFHTYNWHVSGGRRKGTDFLDFYNDQLNMLEAVAGVSDLFVWTFGEDETLDRRRSRSINGRSH